MRAILRPSGDVFVNVDDLLLFLAETRGNYSADPAGSAAIGDVSEAMAEWSLQAREADL